MIIFVVLSIFVDSETCVRCLFCGDESCGCELTFWLLVPIVYDEFACGNKACVCDEFFLDVETEDCV